MVSSWAQEGPSGEIMVRSWAQEGVKLGSRRRLGEIMVSSCQVEPKKAPPAKSWCQVGPKKAPPAKSWCQVESSWAQEGPSGEIMVSS